MSERQFTIGALIEMGCSRLSGPLWSILAPGHHGHPLAEGLIATATSEVTQWPGLVRRRSDRSRHDRTGLPGQFDFDVEYAPAANINDPQAGSSIFTALREQYRAGVP